MTEISLSFTTITNEIMALTALRKVTSSDPERNMLVTPDQLPGLRVIARMVFAETLLLLGDIVADSCIDDFDIEADHPYNPDEAPSLSLTLADGINLNHGALITLRRHLEHAVAAGILGWVATEADGQFAHLLDAQRRAAIDAVTAAIRASAPFSPPRIHPWP